MSPHGVSNASTSPLDVSFCVAQFIRFFGAETFDDGKIGWKFFWLLYSHMKRLRAVERVEHTQAMTIAGGVLMGGDGVHQFAKNDIREAYQ